MKTLLLTGVTGYLGSHLVRHLSESYSLIGLKRTTSNLWRIKNLQGQIRLYDVDSNNLKQVFSNHEIDAVIHLACCQGRNSETSIQLVETNILFSLALLEFAACSGVKTFINTDTSLEKYINMYSLSKRQFTEWFTFYQEKIHCVNIALEMIYGPNDDHKKFVTWLIGKMLHNESIDLTEGTQKRDFIYIDDVVTAMETILDTSLKETRGLSEFELGSGKGLPIKEIVTQLKEICKSQSELNFGVIPMRENEPLESYANNESLCDLGWKPMVALKDGLKATVASENCRSTAS